VKKRLISAYTDLKGAFRLLTLLAFLLLLITQDLSFHFSTDRSDGARRYADMGLEMDKAEKQRKTLSTNPSHDAKHIHSGTHQHAHPLIAFFALPDV